LILDMDVRVLRYVEAVARLGSFTKAAAELRIAQPALSIAVKKLEDELQVRLFIRQPKRVVTTSEGTLLLGRAKRIFQEFNALRQEFDTSQGLSRGELRVGLPPNFGVDYFPSLLATYNQKYPGISVVANTSSASETRRQIEDGAIDLGLVESRFVAKNWKRAEVGQDEIVLCVRKGHPLARKKSVTGRDLDQLPMVIFDKSYVQRAILDQRCEECGAQPRVVLQSNYVPLISKAACEGLGAATLRREIAEKHPELVAIPFDPVETFCFYLCWRDDQLLSRASQAFIEHAREFYSSKQVKTRRNAFKHAHP
jgi:DNA-binding transcriptional LysR family regulator